MTAEEQTKFLKEAGPQCLDAILASLAAGLGCQPSEIGLCLFICTTASDDEQRIQLFGNMQKQGVIAVCQSYLGHHALGELNEPHHPH